MYFDQVTPAEASAAMVNPLAAAPTPCHYGIPPDLGRSDIKKHRYRPKTNPLNLPGRYIRNGPKSARWVTAAAEARAEVALGQELEEDPIEVYEEDRLERAGRSGEELVDDPIEDFSD